MDARALADAAVAELRRRGDPERRAHTAGYFPTSMEILGISAARQREVLKIVVENLEGHPAESVLSVARVLLARKIHEARQVAYELLGRRRDVWTTLDRAALERLGEGNDNWASVDTFAVNLSGPAWREGRLKDADVHGWARSPDIWWRRTALVSTVPLNVKSRGGTGDPRRTLAVCERLARDREPMVAKALSWALRALVPVDPDAVRAFLSEWEDELPALVCREAGNKLRTGRKNPPRSG